MTDKQIQPARRRDYQITPRTRPRGLWGQVWTVVLQPGYFFRTLPPMSETRSWLWAAIFILALTGISAVRQEALLNPPEANLGGIDFGGAPPGTDLGGGKDLGGGGGNFEVAPVGVPEESVIPPVSESPLTNSADVTDTWTTVLLTAAGIILGWFILMILLSEVSLFNGRAPIFGHNLQIAIWASVPLALLAGLQLVYYAAGGTVGQSGLSGLLAEWDAYQTMPAFTRSLILSFTSRLTLFWIWSLILIYVGARNALHGRWFASLLVVAAWMVVLVIVPVVTGAIKSPEMADESGLPELIIDPASSEGGMPEGLSDPFGSSEGELIGVTPEAESGELTGDSITPEVQGEPNNVNGESTADEPVRENAEGNVIQGEPQSIEPTPIESENTQPTAIPSNKGL